MISVVIADDHSGVRQGLRGILEKAHGIEVIGEAGDGGEAVEIVRERRPNVLLLDVELPGMTGSEVARVIQQEGLEVKILAISSYDDLQYVRGMRSAGAAGYLTKQHAPGELVQTIRGVAEGGKTWFGEPLPEDLRVKTLPMRSSLSEREIRVLGAIAGVENEHEVAAELAMSEVTLKAYLSMLKLKFRVETAAELVEIARREGYA